MQRSNLEDIYSLSPMQEGMLFHSISSRGQDVYYQRICCTLQGRLDIEAFKRAWRNAVVRHPVLRTIFSWEHGDRPLQVVLKRLDLPWAEQDLSTLKPEQQQRGIEAFLEADQAQGFDLSMPPLMRLTLLKLDETSSRFVWSFHHILVDGWSAALVLRQVFEEHRACCEARQPVRPAARPFRDYIRWLRAKDVGEAEAFWKQALGGFREACQLGIDRLPTAGSSHAGDLAVHERALPGDLAERLQTLARRLQLTLNTVMQGAWALLLHKYGETDDVVFGTTVHGRPVDLNEVDSIVGLFINTLPLRITLRPEESLSELLGRVQAASVDMRDHEHVPLVQIQRLTEVPAGRPLFESILIFESVAIEEILPGPGSPLEAREVDLLQQTSYPIALVVLPGKDGIQLRLNYDRGRLCEAGVRQMADHLVALVEAMAERPEAMVGTIAAAIEVPRLELVLAASFTVEPLVEPLEHWMRVLGLPCRIRCAPYGQIFQELMMPGSSLRSNRRGCNIILLRPEDWAQGAGSTGAELDQRLQGNVAELLQLLEEAARDTDAVLMLCLCPPSAEALKDRNMAAILARATEQARAGAAAVDRVVVLDAEEIAATCPVAAVNDALADREGHIPFTQPFFAAMATALVRRIVRLGQPVVRAIVLDGEGVLWQPGATGDPVGLHTGPELVAAQQRLAEEREAGRALCLCGDQDERRLFAQLRQHRDLPLRLSRLTSWRLGGDPVSKQVESMASELGISVDEVLFLSVDQERCAEVMSECPEALTLRLPSEPVRMAEILDRLWVLDGDQGSSRSRGATA